MENNKQLVVMVGPAGAGKSTFSKAYKELGFTYVNQDSQGRIHLDLFSAAIKAGENVIVDRMGFSKQQRSRYLDPAREAGYKTKIIVLHESYETCFSRCMARKGHETIKEEEAARGALNMFFTKYERVEDSEADEVQRIWPSGSKALAIICDLDGTLCNVDHRLHFVKKSVVLLDKVSDSPDENKPKPKSDWKGFFDAMSEDKVNGWCNSILKSMEPYKVVLCSGRPDSYKRDTVAWLKKHEIAYDSLFMRNRADHRQDNVVKEILLDFEILTRYTPYFMIDDRQQVVDMWRKRGYTCLQCANGDF